MRKTRGVKIILAIICSFSWNVYAKKETKKIVRMAGASLVGGDFELTNHLGVRVSNKTFSGKYLLVFFGFTHCPSVCPVGMHRLASVMKDLGPQSNEVQPLFISVDPERDSVEVLSEFVKRFDSRIVGLRGTPQEIESLASRYHAYYQKLPSPQNDKNNYLMDHSSIIYLMDKRGSYLSHFESNEGVQKIVTSIQNELKIDAAKSL